ncbi:PAS domain-containing sensor histidine kinase [uncultured Mucilaginibacter sp.]|uniref:sensor histidine kinase n=1 Tax=uncultured Mucilaginibacter sp. TaxID=797541 RepID=UPI0025E8C450|nr:PAS domain-containing sensor histidine kinase [uncultured Mucilaginibacter sp.]
MSEHSQLLKEIEFLKAERKLLTERVALLESQQESNSSTVFTDQMMLRTVADYLPVMVWTAQPDGFVDFVNKGYTEYCGQTIAEALSDGWVHIVFADDLDATTRAWQMAIETGNAYEIQYRLKRASDNSFRWHQARALPISNAQGQTIQWFGTIIDIHEQKETEAAKDEFLSIASHELRTPLTSAKALIDLSKRMADPAEKVFQFVDRASGQLKRLERLIADLLDVSKIHAGKMVYNKESFDFAAVLQDTISLLQSTAGNHQLLLEQNDAVTITGDQVRIEQVINNLISNAIKYSPDANKVVIRSSVQHDNLVVSVQDFGIGISEENLNRIFDRYYRADNSYMRFQGLGLGLYIAAEIIKRHNGSLWIESEAGKGSTFYFLLPLNGKQYFIDIDTDNQTFYKGNFITINYNEQMNWLDVNWLGYQNYDSVKKGCLIMLDLLRKNKCAKVLNDNTHVLGNWSEAADWGGEYWFPAMQEAGLKHFAWIYSPSTFSRLSAHKSIDITMGKVTAQFFDSLNEAKQWLAAQAG